MQEAIFPSQQPKEFLLHLKIKSFANIFGGTLKVKIS